MKKRNIIRVIVIITGMALSAHACNDSIYEVFTRSMVTDYGIPEEMVVDKTFQRNLLEVQFYTSGIMNKTTRTSDYDSWCRKHGDMSYNREIEIHKSYEVYPHEFIAVDYASIEVTCDTEWGENHPAGSSLGDIVTLYAVSPIKYIRSGYTQTYDWDAGEHPKYFVQYMGNSALPYRYHGTVAAGVTPFHPVIKRLDRLTPEDMELLGTGNLSDRGDGRTMSFLLEFDTRSLPGQHRTITVTVNTDEGKTFSASIELTM